jgi:hypothetical protein
LAVPKYVALIHPTTIVQQLRDNKKVTDAWWTAYFARKLETKERSQEQRLQKQTNAAKVIPIFSQGSAPVPAPPTPVAAISAGKG